EREAQRTLRDAKREAEHGRRESERAERERRRAGKPRIGATIWGLLLVLAGLSIGAASLGTTFDLVLAAVIVLCLGGIALIAGSIRAALRRQG
ncbi:MAG: hypothetical protein LBM66_06200, partial [Bifidobacteriaceae bacterium]|nr:hypothetical protein [Bifidobacteriaceae bacterium]